MRISLIFNVATCLFLSFLMACSDDEHIGGGNNPEPSSPAIPEDMSLMVNPQNDKNVSAMDARHFYFVQLDTTDMKTNPEGLYTYLLCRRERETGTKEILHKVSCPICPFDNLYIRDGYLYYTTFKFYDTSSHSGHRSEFWRMDTRTLRLEELLHHGENKSYKASYVSDSIFCRLGKLQCFSMDYQGKGSGIGHDVSIEYDTHFPLFEYDGRYYFKTSDSETLNEVILSTLPDRSGLQTLYQMPDWNFRVKNCFVYQGRIYVLMEETDFNSRRTTYYTLLSFLPDGSDQQTVFEHVNYGGNSMFGLAGNKLFVCTLVDSSESEPNPITELRHVDLQTAQTHLFLTKSLAATSMNVLLEDQVVLLGSRQLDGREQTFVCDLQGNCTLY